MAPLGSRQLERLKTMAHVSAAQVVPDAVSRALVARGLMQPTAATARSADGPDPAHFAAAIARQRRRQARSQLLFALAMAFLGGATLAAALLFAQSLGGA